MPRTPADSDERSTGVPEGDVRVSGPRKILFFVDVFGGGTGNHILAMLRRWDPSRWSPEIVSVRGIGRWMDTGDIPTRSLRPWRKWEFFPIGHFLRLVEVWRCIRGTRPRIVHAYFFWSILFSRILRILGVVDCLVENREDMGFNWARFEYACLRMTRRIPDRVICVCDAVRKAVLEREMIAPGKVITIRNGIDPNEPPSPGPGVREELGLPPETPVVGMVANFNRPVKGVADFLDAIPLILEKVPTACFIILGRGQEEEVLRGKADSLGIGSSLIFAGFHEDVGRWYRAMDVSVLTSHSEGLSITILESMRHGVPIVATRVGGNPEVVVDGVTGYLVPPKEPQLFADKVMDILQRPELGAKMGAEGKRRIAEAFSIESVAGRYIEVYESLADGG